MSVDAWITLAVIGLCFGALIFTRRPPDAILFGGVAVLVLFDVITPDGALIGMSNQGMATVGVLFVVAHALTHTGVVAWVSKTLLGRPRSLPIAQFKLMTPVVLFSSVLNNTPVVAMLVPAVSEWARRFNLSVSQLMIPLSYAAIIGGVCTLVGTSTNLVINGMMLEMAPDKGLGIFDLAWVGVPCSIVVIGYVMLVSRWLLPNRIANKRRFEDTRQYIVEMHLEAFSPMTGATIEDAGLRHLPGMYLVEIERDGRLITAVAPDEILCANDRLVFAGNVESVADLQKMHGLRPAENQIFKLDSERAHRSLVEVVVSNNFPGLGSTVRDSKFRNRYGAAIIAVAREGEQLRSRIGDIVLKPGDTLLLEAPDSFVEQQQYSRDFLLVSRVRDSKPLRYERRLLASIIVLGMVISAATGLLSMFEAALFAAGTMVVTRCITIHAARQSVDWQVLLVIAASIAIGGAVDKTGLANVIADYLTGIAAGSAFATLVAIFVLTAGFSALISNLAAAVLIFPIAVAASAQLGVDVTPYAVTIMIAASASFATPIGYQTNLMVYGPGDYRFSDFLKIGVPLTVLVGLITVFLVPLVWPFQALSQ